MLTIDSAIEVQNDIVLNSQEEQQIIVPAGIKTIYLQNKSNADVFFRSESSTTNDGIKLNQWEYNTFDINNNTMFIKNGAYNQVKIAFGYDNTP
ncbi:hypothetical protein OGY35_23860 [Citrobacter sp. Ct235]|uniref:hypothetical protein n=1 Tax=Citrobacter sp. Ct235 TaxID=2985157 RepID=UPI002574D4B3|nr:hypothetical protein [Citrobacter sp. Ct235]MDM2738392.1 hypothetical protein [Citrobacter sp. Ct235]